MTTGTTADPDPAGVPVIVTLPVYVPGGRFPGAALAISAKGLLGVAVPPVMLRLSQFADWPESTVTVAVNGSGPPP